MKKLKSPSLLLIALLMLVWQPVLADSDDDGAKVNGTAEGFFTQFDFLKDIDGNLIFNVELEGQFMLKVRGWERYGTFRYPHLLQFPADPAGIGTLAGVGFWYFDNGTTCIGPLAGTVGANGGQTHGKLNCSDGTALVLRVRDDEVIPGVSIKSSLQGRLIYHPEDH